MATAEKILLGYGVVSVGATPIGFNARRFGLYR